MFAPLALTRRRELTGRVCRPCAAAARCRAITGPVEPPAVVVARRLRGAERATSVGAHPSELPWTHGWLHHETGYARYPVSSVSAGSQRCRTRPEPMNSTA